MQSTSPPRAEPLLPGWYTLGEQPQLIGSHYFPRLAAGCRNPDCVDSRLEDVPLSRSGRLWSFTSASYQPPAPYVAGTPAVQP